MISDRELREILLEDADDAPQTPAGELMAGIRHKVKIRRRTRIATTTAALAAVIAASLAIVPTFTDNTAPEPVDPIQPRLEFPGRLFPDRLVASHVNEPGASAFEWELIARRGMSTTYAFCRVPPETPHVVVQIAVDGKRVARRGCTTPDRPNEVAAALRRDDLWEVFALGPYSHRSWYEPGESYVVSMWLEQDGERVEIPRAAIGMGLYWLKESWFKGTSIGRRPTPQRGPNGARAEAPTAQTEAIVIPSTRALPSTRS